MPESYNTAGPEVKGGIFFHASGAGCGLASLNGCARAIYEIRRGLCLTLLKMKTKKDISETMALDDQEWERVAESFRRACSLYHRGKEAEAMSLASEELPPLIAQWSQTSRLGGNAKRHRLISLFMEEGKRVGEMALLQKMLFAHMSAQATATRNARAVMLGESGLAGTIRLRQERDVKIAV
jgi:hypothetical protein